MGAKIVFSPNCWDVKNEVFEQKIAFLFLPFLLEQDKQKGRKNKYKKKTAQKKCFGGGWEKVDFVKIGMF